MKPHITEAKPEDVPQLSMLLEQLGYPTSESETLPKLDLYSPPDYKILVARSDTNVLGFIALNYYQTFHLPGPVGRITSFCVDERVRGTGIGNQLLAAAEEYFLANLCYKIEVTSNIRRTATHPYYLKRGYSETSKHFVKILAKK
ncbi:MAG: GNAT family N-acetyltransferase [Cyclobacteriaceae bacterium]|nr:GNAT family N-acetyltransferase [Cyclobacteriaceae bacterium]